MKLNQTGAFSIFEVKANILASLTNISNCKICSQHRPYAECQKEQNIQHSQWISVIQNFQYDLNKKRVRFSATTWQAVLLTGAPFQRTPSLHPGPALSRCNRCSCIGPRAPGAPRHGVWVDFSFFPDTPCA